MENKSSVCKFVQNSTSKTKVQFAYCRNSQTSASELLVNLPKKGKKSILLSERRETIDYIKHYQTYVLPT